MRLNLGSGSTPKKDDVINVDIADLPQVDVVHDLDVTPWPFDDACAHEVFAMDVFEHVNNPVGFMTESHRVLEPAGQLYIKVPHFRHPDAYTDPTHKRFCTEHTWDYWIKGTVLYEHHNPAYGGVSFELRDRKIIQGSIFVVLQKN